jgi:hypothetical protein
MAICMHKKGQRCIGQSQHHHLAHPDVQFFDNEVIISREEFYPLCQKQKKRSTSLL